MNKKNRSLALLFVAAMIGTLVAGTPRIEKTNGKIRAVQLDLARKKESLLIFCSGKGL